MAWEGGAQGAKLVKGGGRPGGWPMTPGSELGPHGRGLTSKNAQLLASGRIIGEALDSTSLRGVHASEPAEFKKTFSEVDGA